MQTTDKLNINPQVGKSYTQIPAEWFRYVNNVLRFLQVRNGKLFVNDDKWTIECGGGGGIEVAGTKAEYKVIILLKDANNNLVETWDYIRLP